MSRRMQPRVTGRPMRTEQFAEGTVHYSSYRAAYLEPPPKLTSAQTVRDPENPGQPLLDAKGQIVKNVFQVRQPWRRITPKAVRPGAARRAALREQRANA